MKNNRSRSADFESDTPTDDEDVEDFEFDSPTPLFGQPEPGEPFPIDALDGLLKDAAIAIHNIVQSPLAMCGQSVLAASALAVQGHCNVKIRGEEPKPLSCYFATIAESGERKTSTDRKALSPIVKWENQLRMRYRGEIADYTDKHQLWQTERDRILRQRKDPPLKAFELEELGKAPISPLEPIQICEEPTWEGLLLVLDKGPGTCGLFSNEAGMFASGFAMTNEQRLKTAGGLSKLWDGETIKRIRATEERRYLVGKRLSVHLMFQPNVAETFLCNPDLRRQGLTSRFLINYPASTMGTRFHTDTKKADQEAVVRYEDYLLQILREGLPAAEETPNELEPDMLRFSRPAGDLLRKFGDDVERELAEDGRYRAIPSFAAKMREHAARLAGVLALIEDFSSASIKSAHVDAGIALSRYYAEEWLRIVNLPQYDSGLVDAEKLRTKLIQEWDEDHISLVDAYRQKLAGVKNKQDAIKRIGILEEHGWLHQVASGTVVKGTRREDVWRIVRP